MADFIHRRSHPIICQLEARVIEGGIFSCLGAAGMAVRHGFRGYRRWGWRCGADSVGADANGSYSPYLVENRGFGILTAVRDLISGKVPRFSRITGE